MGACQKTARGFAIHVQNLHGATTGAIRRARNPQRVRCSHGATTGAIRHARSPQRVRCSCGKFARCHNGSHSTRTIPAKGSTRVFKIRTAPQRERSDTHDPLKGFDAIFSKFARRHNGSDSTRTIPAEGSLFMWKIRMAPQRERFDTHDPRRGFAVHVENSHGATTGAMRRGRNPQRVRSDDSR